MIEFHDVTVCYEPHKLHPVRSIDGLNLKIERGDWVFLVGPSGAGKSSLLKLIYAGTPIQNGRIMVDGEDISHLTRHQVPFLRRKIGIVFQDFQLLGDKTAWENVAFALRVIGAPQAIIVKEVPRALETVGLAHRAEAFPHELSGGEQQRVAIARAIVNDPKILLCDEPTGNLDPKTAREVGQLLTKINFERGTTIVMATHDRSFVNDMARRVVRLQKGRLISDENPGIYGTDEPEESEQVLQVPALLADLPPGKAPETPTPAVSPTPLPAPASMAPPATAPPTLAPVAPPVVVSTPQTTAPLKAEVAPPPTAPKVASPREERAPQPPITPTPPVVVTPPAAIASTPPPKAAPAPQTPSPPRPATSLAPLPSFSEDMPIDDFPVPSRPMARRLAPSDTSVTPPPSDHVLDPNVSRVNPNAPLGSPENPIVQYE